MLLALLLLPPVGILLLRTYPVQTFVARKAAQYLSKELNTSVEVGTFKLTWFFNLVISDLTVRDQRHNMLLQAGKLKVNLKSVDIKKQGLVLNEISLINGKVNLVKYRGDSALNIQFLVDYFSPATTDTTPSKPWKVQCHNFKIQSSSFAYLDENSPPQERGINFSRFSLANLDLDVRNLKLNGDTYNADIVHIACDEKSGFSLKNLSAGISVSPQNITADSLKIETGRSNLALNLKLKYPNWDAFSSFIDSVNFDAGISPSRLDMRDIVSLVPDIYGMEEVFDFTGNIKGTVSSFSAREFRLAFGSSTAFAGNIKLTGLPDWTETFAHLKIDEFVTHVRDIASFTIPYSGGRNTISIPPQLAALGNLRVRGKFTGFYNDFVSKATFETDAGTLASDILLTNNRQTKSVEYDGKIIATGFNAGRVFGVSKIGTLNIDAVVKGKDFSFEHADLTVNGKVTDLQYDGNTIGNIDVDGAFRNKQFAGGVRINDELAGLDFKGRVDLSGKLPVFDFGADISKANLQRLNILPADSITGLSTSVSFKFSGSNIDNMLGSLQLSNTSLNKGSKNIKMNSLLLNTRMLDAENKRMQLTSDFVDAEFTGKFTFDDLNDYITLVLTDYLPSLSGNIKQPERTNKGSFDYSISLKNTEPLTSIFLPWLSADRQTRLSGSFNPSKGQIYIEGSSPLIAVQGVSFRNWSLEGNSSESQLQLRMASDVVDMSGKAKRDESYKSIDRFNMLSVARNDSVFFAVNWDDLETPDHYKGNIFGNVSFAGYPKLAVRFDNAKLLLNDTLWTMLPDNYITIDSACLYVRNAGFVHGTQHIILNGTASADPLDQMQVDFNDFNISNTDLFLNPGDIDFDGFLSGTLKVSDVYSFPQLTAGLNVKKFGFNHEFLGDADIVSSWDNKNSVLTVDTRVVYVGNVGTHYPVKASGKIYPLREHNNFDIAADIDNLKVRTMEPFFTGLFSRIRGLASGHVTLTGDFSDPVLTGSLKLMRSELLVDYIRTSYSFTGDLNFDKDLMWFKNIQINDSTGSSGIVSGTIKHRAFTDWALDISLSADNLTALNTPYNPDEMYYGRAKVTGTMSLKGPVDNLVMKARAKSEKGTSVVIPISFARGISENDFIQYRNADTLEAGAVPVLPAESSVVTLDLGLNVTPDADLEIILPYQMGNIQAKGDGTINMGIDTRGDYSMHGQYLIDKGNFLFNFENIFKRNFDIQKGGTITFNGSPYDADIRLEAVYKIKTTLGGLPNIDPQYSSRRVPVDCRLKLSNNLYNPDIKFSIDLPDATEEVKRMVFSSIDTSNTIAMNQQMISLLVLNSFSSTSGIVLNNSTLGTSSYDLLSNQLSNWLSQISKDFDIGVNYRPGDQISPQELELALSTQLFDNRVSFESNLGRSTAVNSVQTSRWVGDVMVEVKLTEDGRFRVKAFNRTNTTLDLYSGQAPYTQGVGILMRKDFDTFGQMIRRKQQADAVVKQKK